MRVVFEPEPSPLVQQWVASQAPLETTHLRPWRLPAHWLGTAPPGLRRFADSRCNDQGKALPGYVLVELLAGAWAGTRSNRRLHSRLLLRRTLGYWAAQQSVLARASEVIAPSCAARSALAAAPQAKKILLMDMPCIRQLHSDLEGASALHSRSFYLRRYRAPDWVIVDQEVEWRLADEIHVRGRFAERLLLEQGIPASRIRLRPPLAHALAPRQPVSGQTLQVLLPGLATARNGSYELLELLQDLPWLHVHARVGEGSEPEAFLLHPRVHIPVPGVLSRVDALVVPSFCETYLPELLAAREAGLPILATERGAANVPSSELYAELPPHFGPPLRSALDALHRSNQAFK